MSNEDIVRKYLNATADHDVSEARACLDDSFKFHGPIEQHDSAEAFIESFGKLIPQIAGIEIAGLVSSGSDVVVHYDFRTSIPGVASTRTCEWFTVEGGKIVASQLYFDASKWREIFAAMSGD